MTSEIHPTCNHVSCGPESALSLAASIAGLLAISDKAIPPLILATTSPNVKQSPRLLSLRDEMLKVSGNLYMLQSYFISTIKRKVDLQSLLAALSGCVLAYSDIEGLFSKSRGSVQRLVQTVEGIWNRCLITCILQRVRIYSTVLGSIVDVLQSEFMPDKGSKVQSCLNTIDETLKEDKYLIKRLGFHGASLQERTPSQSNILPLIFLSNYSALSLPIDLTDVNNSTWYTDHVLGDSIFEKLLQDALKIADQPVGSMQIRGFPTVFARKRHHRLSAEDQEKRNARVEVVLQLANVKFKATKNIFMFGARDTICDIIRQMELEYGQFQARQCPTRDELFNFLLGELNCLTYGPGCKDVSEREETQAWLALLSNQNDILRDEIPNRAFLPAFVRLWGDAKVQAALKLRSEKCFEFFQLYHQNPTKIFHNIYLPTILDPQIPYLPQPPGTVNNLSFEINGTIYNILQSTICGERSKWIQCIDNVDAIIYVVDVGSYDQTVDFNLPTTYLTEDTIGFQSVAQSRWFINSQVALLFTNIDEFRAKIASGKRPIRSLYARYEGGERDVDGGLAFLTDLFLASVPGRRVEVEYTYPKDKNVLGKVGQCLSFG